MMTCDSWLAVVAGSRRLTIIYNNWLAVVACSRRLMMTDDDCWWLTMVYDIWLWVLIDDDCWLVVHVDCGECFILRVYELTMVDDDSRWLLIMDDDDLRRFRLVDDGVYRLMINDKYWWLFCQTQTMVDDDVWWRIMMVVDWLMIDK